MKILKLLFIIIVISFVGTTTIILADYSHSFTGITLPNFSKYYNSPDMLKSDASVQKVKKLTAVDKLSGNDMAVMGLVERKSGSAYIKGTEYDLVTNKFVEMGYGSQQSGTFRLKLRAKNSFLTEGRFTGIWQYEYTS